MAAFMSQAFQVDAFNTRESPDTRNHVSVFAKLWRNKGTLFNPAVQFGEGRVSLTSSLTLRKVIPSGLNIQIEA